MLFGKPFEKGNWRNMFWWNKILTLKSNGKIETTGLNLKVCLCLTARKFLNYQSVTDMFSTNS